MSCLLLQLKNPAGKRYDLSWPEINFLHYPTMPHPPTIKPPPKKKINKTMLSVSLIGFSHKVDNVRIEKQINVLS